MKFSIITVCLNPGEKLKITLESILGQTCSDFEVILKDGGSSDGSVEKWRQWQVGQPGGDRVRVFVEKDSGIYDAMNQAVSHARGEFLLFLNCGDVLPDERVLERTLEVIEKEQKAGIDMDKLVLYGDTCSEKNHVIIASAPEITGFTCYRNIPCHQSCFYSAGLCKERPYDLQYKIRADYDHFLWCFYRAKARMRHMGFPVASYEGGGYSENPENRERDRKEHEQITASYMSKGELLKYRVILICTLASIRRWMAESRGFSGVYHWVKERVYRRKYWIVTAILFFLLEMTLLVWPVGWLKEDTVSYLTGENSWVLQASAENPGYCQEFAPSFENVKSIGIVVVDGDSKVPEDGNMSVTVSDSDNNILFETRIPYDYIQTGSYSDISMNLSLERGRSYYLSVNFEADENGNIPSLAVCGEELFVPENIRLTQQDEVDHAHLMTKYVYRDCLLKEKIAGALFLGIMTFLGIALGLPKNPKVRKFLGILLLIIGPYILGNQLEWIAVNTSEAFRDTLLPFAMKWNLGLMYLFELILLLCTQSVRFSFCFSSTFLTLLYSASYYMYSYRGQFLRLNDLAAIGTAARVVGQYDLHPNSAMALSWGILICFLVYGIQTKIPRKKRKISRRVGGHLVSFALGIFLTIVSGYQLLCTNMLVEKGFYVIYGFGQNRLYLINGFLVGSLMDIQLSRITEPDGYSVEKVRDLLEGARDSQKNAELEKEPHIILVMNESFSDLRILGNLQISEENLLFFNSLTENTVRGYVNASVLGGGTANSEFEVFTGCSMGFLPFTYYPYQQCIVKPIPSLISTVADAGYTTYSMHPEADTNWNRKNVYQYLGFEHCLWKEEFQDAEVVHYGVSDLETYKKVEELFENRQVGEKLFIFDLTIQNHGGYIGKDGEQTVTAVNVSSGEADVYLSLIHESDEAFKELVTYFEQQDEPVIICMFGDHQPKLSDDDFYQSIYNQTEGMTERDKTLNMYKTPFIIWANYDIPEQRDLDISMNYLGTLLLDVIGLPCSPYFSFLQQYMEEYPIITVNGYQDMEGNFYNWSGESSELSEYRMIQYNYLFDRNKVEWGY